jgi:hypothetical protein
VGDETDDAQCDVPGNGHDNHDVEPGHDKNNDGVDDRCQQDEVEEPPVDNGGGDIPDSTEETDCNVPGNGHDKHDVEPGHDKNDDGIEDRCQEGEADSPNQDGSPDNNGASAAAHHQNGNRKDDS